MKTTDTCEKSVEALIVESLVNEATYRQGRSKDYDRDHAVDLFYGTPTPIVNAANSDLVLGGGWGA